MSPRVSRPSPRGRPGTAKSTRCTGPSTAICASGSERSAPSINDLLFRFDPEHLPVERTHIELARRVLPERRDIAHRPLAHKLRGQLLLIGHRPVFPPERPDLVRAI